MPAHARADRRPSLLDRPLLTAVVGAVAGAVIAACLILTGSLSPPPAPPKPAAPDAAGAFLSAWRGHLLASWSADEVEQQTTAAGATIRFQVHEAQRPPDSVRTGGGTVDARRGSVLIACSTLAGGSHPVCREGPAPGTWRQVVDAQIAGLRPFLTGPLRVYRVVALAPDCFRLDLVVRATRLPPALALGARYCIDPGTQAVLSSSQRLAAAVITITARSVHAPATDADLALPAGATYER